MVGDLKTLHYPAGSTAYGPWTLALTPEYIGWGWAGLRVVDLPRRESVTFATGSDEVLVLPLSGSCVVECDGHRAELAGRADVFAGPTDFVYVPVNTVVTVSSGEGGRFAVPAARAQASNPSYPFRHVAADKVTVEARGAGNCSRLVHGYCMPDTLDADRLMVCEVITPGGNWSSYPPHKHDEEREGESVLEEIYYFQVAEGPSRPGVGYQRVYGTSERPIEVLAEVRSGDVVLVPHGWHGPSTAPPGYDLYYLNVMAGPGGERAWRICDDPAYAWVRDTWRDQPVDPRVLDAVRMRRTT
jgi:5-deoxy-glucuronate isomerase